MQYAVFTTKHHDGFCLWDTALTGYKAPRAPVGRDLVREFVDAFRARGIRIGLYYSLTDWHHPDFPLDPAFGPYHDHPDRAAMNVGRDPKRYDLYLHAQVRELLTQYGRIDELWFDGGWSFDNNGVAEPPWDPHAVHRLVRELQPHVVLNDRLGVGADIGTPEQSEPAGPLSRGPWELCQTLSGSWGYNRDESTWKSVEQLLVMLASVVGKGGNLLLNVGPDGRGGLQPGTDERMQEIAKWMALHIRSIHGCGPVPTGVQVPPNCLATYHAARRRLYLHVLSWPTSEMVLAGLGSTVRYAQLLHDGSEVPVNRHHHELFSGHARDRQDANYYETIYRVTGQPPPRYRSGHADAVLLLPIRRPDVAIPVVEVFLRK